MKIAFNGRSLTQSNITGVQRYSHGVSNALSSLLSPEDFRIFRPSPGARKFTKHLWEHLSLPKIASDWKAKILFNPGNTCPIFKQKVLKVVTVIHDLSFLDFPEAYSFSFKIYYKKLIPKVLYNSDLLFTVSESERSGILNRFPELENKLYYAPNGIDLEFFSNEIADFQNTGKYVLYVGSLSKRKNFQGILQCFSLIYNEIPHNLYIIGNAGPPFTKEKKLEELLGRIPSDRIRFLGQINEKKILASYYKNADCLVFPSFYESSGLPPSEAMASGCPVVVSSIPALKERCGNAAIYCDPSDIQDIKEKLLLILNNESLRQNLIEKGKDWAKRFNWDETTKSILRVLEKYFQSSHFNSYKK